MTISISSPSVRHTHYSDKPAQRERLLHGVILLAGGSSQAAFASATQRPAMQLPVTDSQSLAALWRDNLATVVDRFEPAPIPVRIVGGASFTLATQLEHPSLVAIANEEPEGFRGTGGILRDLSLEYDDDAYLLVASAAALLLQPLGDVIDELIATDADVAFHVHDDGSASTIMLVRCGCLRSIPSMGFIDLKEQALAHYIAADAISIVRTRQPVAISMRSPAKYLRALRTYHRRIAHSGRGHDQLAFAEDWRPLFQLVEPGAQVGATIRVHDGVVLAGASVGDGALIARSIICPGARIAGNATIIDRIVTADANHPIVMPAEARR